MSRAAAFDVNATLLAVAAAICAGGAVYIGLVLIARPAGLERRLAVVAQQADDADRLKARSGGPSPYSVGAVCEGGADAGAAALRQRINLTASKTGVVIEDVSANPQTPDDANRGLQPVTVTIKASGQYAAVVGLLQTLAKSTPSVFVDTLDLKSGVGAVSLKLSGRLFCSPAGL